MASIACLVGPNNRHFNVTIGYTHPQSCVAPIIRYNICTIAYMHPMASLFYKLQPLLHPIEQRFGPQLEYIPLLSRPIFSLSLFLSLSLSFSLRAFTSQLISRRCLFVKIAVKYSPFQLFSHNILHNITRDFPRNLWLHCERISSHCAQ